MQNKDKGDGIEEFPLDMLLVILLEGASKEVVTPSSARLVIVTLCEPSLGRDQLAWGRHHSPKIKSPSPGRGCEQSTLAFLDYSLGRAILA